MIFKVYFIDILVANSTTTTTRKISPTNIDIAIMVTIAVLCILRMPTECWSTTSS